MPDWYDRSMNARATWHANWATQLPAFAAKYDISAAELAQVAEDNAWLQYWAQVRHDAANINQQLTKYFNEIVGNDETLPKPDEVNFSLSGTPPVQPPCGIEARTRRLVRQIKGDAEYSQADGEALGIVRPESADLDTDNIVPEFTLRTLANFEVQASFRKRGMDAVKLQMRYKGGQWQNAGFLVASPGTLSITPSVANTAEQVEIRAIYFDKNREVGNYSDAKTAFIAP